MANRNAASRREGSPVCDAESLGIEGDRRRRNGVGMLYLEQVTWKGLGIARSKRPDARQAAPARGQGVS